MKRTRKQTARTPSRSDSKRRKKDVGVDALRDNPPSKQAKQAKGSAPTRKVTDKAAPNTACRKSSRERKAPESYNEDKLEAFVHERDEKTAISAGGQFFKYVAPCDPPGMKSTAYNCKYPAMKGPVADEYKGRKPLPTRSAQGDLVFADMPNFRPNLSPAQVLKDGAFGGTYFRPITSAVTGKSYVDAHKARAQHLLMRLPARILLCIRLLARLTRL
jgi:hypothetical protein